MRFQSSSTRPVLATSIYLMTITFCFLSTISSTTALDLIHSHHKYSSDLAKKLVGRGQLHLDTGFAPVAHAYLRSRQVGGDDDNNNNNNDESSSSSSAEETSTSTRPSRTTSASATATSESSDSPTSTDSSEESTSTASSTSASAAPTYTSKSLPVPFDTSIGNNFTTTACPAFMQSFLANSTFRECAPISLLLQNSLSFFQAVRSPPTLEQTLKQSCDASLAVCSPLMASIASNLISDSNCGDDFRRQNPIVTQAYAGLVAYEPLYKASCLVNEDTDKYCFWDAFTNANNNTSAASDSYPYYAAIGIALPATSTPKCTDCLKQTMEIFAGYAQMKGQPLAGTYLGAAQHLNAGCGQGYVDASIQVAVQANANAAPAVVRDTFSVAALVTVISILLMI